MRSVRLWDVIEFEAASWQVVLADGTELALRSLATGTVRRVSVVDLLSSDSFLPQDNSELLSLSDVGIFDALDVQQQARVRFLQYHVTEVLNGVPLELSDERPPKPEYETSRPFLARVDAKVAELCTAGTAISKRTLWRYISGYRRRGLAGLVDGRSVRTASPLHSVDARVIGLLDAALADQRDRSTGTKSRVIAQVQWEAERQSLPVPSRATMYRAVKHLERGRHTFGDATARRSMANRPPRTYGRQMPSRPGELVEIDSTPLDLMVIYPDGSQGRTDLTLALDVATRTVCAAILRPIATKSVDAAVLLARALTPLAMQPGWDAAPALSRSVLPPGMIMSIEDLHEQIAARPLIVPESVTRRSREGIHRNHIHLGVRASADQCHQGRSADSNRQATR